MALDTWNGSVWVVIAVGTNPMCRVTGAARAAIRTASRRPRNPVQARVGRQAVVGLQVQPVLDGEEVQQAALGLLSQLGPVASGEQPLRLGVGLPPRRGMPARAIEGNRQVQGAGLPARALVTDQHVLSDRSGNWYNGIVLPSISLDIVDYVGRL